MERHYRKELIGQNDFYFYSKENEIFHGCQNVCGNVLKRVVNKLSDSNSDK